MKISQTTIQILKNFTKISKDIKFKVGNKLVVELGDEEMLATASVEEYFDHEFCIADLPQFVTLLQREKADSIELEVDDTYAYIKTSSQLGNSVTKYRTADEKVIHVPEKEGYDNSGAKFTFTLKREIFERIVRSASILNCSLIEFSSDGEHVYVECYGYRQESMHSEKIMIGDSDTEFKSVMNLSKLLMIPDDYEVKIRDESMYFRCLNYPVEYWIVEHED